MGTRGVGVQASRSETHARKHNRERRKESQKKEGTEGLSPFFYLSTGRFLLEASSGGEAAAGVGVLLLLLVTAALAVAAGERGNGAGGGGLGGGIASGGIEAVGVHPAGLIAIHGRRERRRAAGGKRGRRATARAATAIAATAPTAAAAGEGGAGTAAAGAVGAALLGVLAARLVLVVNKGARLDGVGLVVLAAAPVAVGLGVFEDVLEAAVGVEVGDADRLAVDADEGVDAVEVPALVVLVLRVEAAPAAAVLGVLEEEGEALVLDEVLDGDGELLALNVDHLRVVVDAAVDVGAAQHVVDNLVVAPDAFCGAGGQKEGDAAVEEEVGDVDGGFLALDKNSLVVFDFTQVDILAGCDLVGGGNGAPLGERLGVGHRGFETLVLEEVSDGDRGGLAADGNVFRSLGGGAVEEGAGGGVVGGLTEAPARLRGRLREEVLNGGVVDEVSDLNLGVLANGKASGARHGCCSENWLSGNNK